MAHGFRVICEKCGSEDYHVRVVSNGEYVETEVTCEECGQVEDI